MSVRRVLVGALMLAGLAAPALAQSPNTAAIVVTVVDQTGGIVKDAKVTVTNQATGASREATSLGDGSATISALGLTGMYTVSVSKQGFTADDVKNLTLRSAETATVRVKLVATGGKSSVTVYGTTEGVRADPQIGKVLNSEQLDETPILGRKVSSLPLLNSAFRSGKGIGDLFVNATYFVTGTGSRRTTTFMLDGSTDDEGWGRQTAVITVPLSAVEEASVLTNAFSAEYGFTAGPAVNWVTKSGTNQLHGEGLYLARPGDLQATSFSTSNFCPPSITTCAPPAGLTAISPVDIPDKLNQFSGSLGGALVKDKTFYFLSGDYTGQDRTTQLSNTLPAFVLDNGSLTYTGQYRQKLFDGRVDHKLSPSQNLMIRVNPDHFFDTNPQDAVIGTTAPTAARIYTRGAWSAQVNHTAILSPNMLNEARFGFTDGDPVTEWGAVVSGTIYKRTAGTAPFTIGANQVANLYSRQATLSDTLTWTRGDHSVRFGGSLARHLTGGVGTEPGQALLGTFTFNNGTAPFDQLTLADVQSYTQPFSFGANQSYTLNQWLGAAFVQDTYRMNKDLTLDLGLRYDRQSLTQSTKDFAPRVGFGWHPNGDARLAIRGGYGMYYTQIQSNVIAGFVQSGLDGFTTYTANPGQVGFPTCLTGACLPVTFSSDPKLAPARNITIIAGKRDFYTQQFAQFGLDFSKVPSYPDQLLSPRSQTASIGAERELKKGLFLSADYVYQYWNNLVRTVDLNAAAPFDRTAPGQVRTTAAADATRPITPVTGGVKSINTIMNLGYAYYNGLQTQLSYRGSSKMFASVSYTLSKAMNTSEPDGNGISPNQPNIAELGNQELGPSLLDQRHRAVLTFTYNLPFNITAGTVTQLASARPINAITGVDNDGDGSTTDDRPVINGVVVGKSAFRGTMTQDVSIFVEGRLKKSGKTIVLRLEGFNLLNHADLIGRGNITFGDTGTAPSTFGQFSTTVTNGVAIPAFANINPPRMFQLLVRVQF
jgi:hypothetical protein